MDKLSPSGPRGFPGVITVHENIVTGESFIIDGQHRAGAIKLLADMGAVPRDDPNILLEVYRHEKDEEAANLFVEINKMEPVRLIDLPSEKVEALEKSILTNAVDHLSEMYPAMFSNSQRCKAPHVNKELIREDLYVSGVVRRLKCVNSDQLVEWLLKKNELLGNLVISLVTSYLPSS